MNLDDPDELKKSKKYHKFQSELQKCLEKVERTPLSDWAGLNNGLVQIQRVIDSSAYEDLPIVPERLLLCRVLGKCLDPMAAMGVHRKAVETLTKVCAKLGPNGIAASLPLLSANVLHLLPCAATQTRPDIMSLLEQHFLTLPLESLALCYPGVLASIAPSLEESDTSDVYRRACSILTSTLKTFEGRNIAQVVYHALWSTVRNAASARVGALLFLRMNLKKAEALPSVEEQMATTPYNVSRPSLLQDVSLASSDTPLVVAALCTALADKNDKSLRLALDLLVFHFPLHEEGVLTFQEVVALMTAALRVLVTNPQNATLRRVFMWIYGGNEINGMYFKTVGFRYVAQALTNMFGVAEENGNSPNGTMDMGACDTMYAFEALLALLSRPEGEEHFLDLIPEVISSVCTAVRWYYKRGAWSSSATSTQKIFRLLDCLPWSYFLQYVRNCGDEVQRLVDLGACGTDVSSQLQTMLDILDATRLHYIAIPSSVTYLPQVQALCIQLSTLVGVLAVQCEPTIATTALEVFHVAYFGVARGLLSHEVRSDESTQTDEGREASPVQVGVTADLQIVVRSFSDAYATVCDYLSGTLTTSNGAAMGADDLFSSGPVSNKGDRSMVKLFADVNETQLSLLSQDRGKQIETPDSSLTSSGLSWLTSAERVVYSCGANVAVCAATLILEAYTNDALTAAQLQTLRSGGLKRLLEFLWALFSVADSEYHVQLTKLFSKLDRRDESRQLLAEMMESVHPSNCRQFYALFRLVADQGTSDFPFRAGLLMMMRALTSNDTNTRLIASGFVEQSLPYLHRITDPLLSQLLDDVVKAETATAQVEAVTALLATIQTLLKAPLVNTTGAAVVQRLWALPLPSYSKQLVDAVDIAPGQSGEPQSTSSSETAGRAQGGRSGAKDPFRAGADNDMIVNNVFSLLLYLAVRVVRQMIGRQHSMSAFMSGSIVSPSAVGSVRIDQPQDELMLASVSLPNISQGEESPHTTLALEFVLEAIRLSTTFSDPPETVANMCTHFAIVASELLTLCVSTRLPMAQLQLVDVYQTCVLFLEVSGRCPTGGSKRPRGQSETSDDGRGGDEKMDSSISPPSSSPGLKPSSRSKRGLKHPTDPDTTGAPCNVPVLTRSTLRMVRHGLIASVLAELHPVMSCYGLFNRWRSFTTTLLPLFHELLHDAVYEIVATHTLIIRCIRERPLAPTAGYLLQRSLQSLIDLVQFLFRPATRIAEGGGVVGGNDKEGGGRKLESVTQLPMWLLQQGLGNAAHAQQDAGGVSNYDLAIKELVVCLELLIPACLDTFLAIRRSSMGSTAVRNRDVAASLQTTRLQVEAPIKVLLEALFKESELEAFERLMFLWGKRNGGSTVPVPPASSPALLAVTDNSDDTLIAELFASSAGVTPLSVVAVCDQLLQRHRRGSMKASTQTKTLGGELAFDVSVFHFLHAFFSKCRGADRLDRVLTPLIDAVIAHLGGWGAPVVSPLALPMVLRLLATIGRRYATANTPISSNSPTTISFDSLLRNERRGATVFQKVLDALSSTGAALADSTDDVIPLALRLVADVLPDYSICYINKDQVDRVAECFGVLFSRVLGPAMSTSMNSKGGNDKVLQLAPRVQTALTVITAFLGTGIDTLMPRKLKTDLIDILFSTSFFRMTRNSVGQWRTIFERLTADRTINGAILLRFNAPPTPQSMLSAIVQSQDDEASNRGRLLKRLAFYVFCVSNIDREFVNGVRDKISETFRQFGRQNKLVPVRYALLVFRVLMTRIPPQLLTQFWPVVLPELIRWLNQKPTGDDDIYLAMEALKVVDFAICVLPSDFQVFRWVFYDDSKSVELLYRGSAANLRSAHMFIPLVKSLGADAEAAAAAGRGRHYDFSYARHETYPHKSSVLTLDGHVPHRPLLAIPERCYLDLKGVDVISSLLQRASNTTGDEATASPTAAAGDAGLVGTTTIELSEEFGLVRQSDHYDVAYVDWLLEAEFMHVGVAASEQKMLAQQSAAALLLETRSMSPQPSALRPDRVKLEDSPSRLGDGGAPMSAPPSPQSKSRGPERDTTSEFVDVGVNDDD
ncbi:Hypothetical protein, putative [Bodo saltans]|uniref:Uncharacterized protein n=1 Tax=Bodo saltans TaxID=75058 RepID=A0A0S4J9S8_BODSA|nr:Hypothetical protein, putative [Bodo saltans]|eukprot:CUG88255.1 Hypothetical protein, putative [Bodo saltans]